LIFPKQALQYTGRHVNAALSYRRADWSLTGAGLLGMRRGVLGARHQPLCGRVRELWFTIESHSIDALEDLQATLLGFGAG